MKEYDLRFPGLHPTRDLARIRILRDTLLEVAGGFTEIMSEQLKDLIPGEGLGYIVALAENNDAIALAGRLNILAGAWRLPSPKILEASRGPRRGSCFVLIPQLANRDTHGYRRPLFSPARWSRIRDAIDGRLSHPIQTVYGEWLSQLRFRQVDSDISYMFIVKCDSLETPGILERFIRTEVFDGGRECDQETIYLSVDGIGRTIDEA